MRVGELNGSRSEGGKARRAHNSIRRRAPLSVARGGAQRGDRRSSRRPEA